jgi:hypothetical protein
MPRLLRTLGLAASITALVGGAAATVTGYALRGTFTAKAHASYTACIAEVGEPWGEGTGYIQQFLRNNPTRNVGDAIDSARSVHDPASGYGSRVNLEERDLREMLWPCGTKEVIGALKKEDYATAGTLFGPFYVAAGAAGLLAFSRRKQMPAAAPLQQIVEKPEENSLVFMQGKERIAYWDFPINPPLLQEQLGALVGEYRTGQEFLSRASAVFSRAINATVGSTTRIIPEPHADMTVDLHIMSPEGADRLSLESEVSSTLIGLNLRAEKIGPSYGGEDYFAATQCIALAGAFQELSTRLNLQQPVRVYTPGRREAIGLWSVDVLSRHMNLAQEEINRYITGQPPTLTYARMVPNALILN